MLRSHGQRTTALVLLLGLAGVVRAELVFSSETVLADLYWNNPTSLAVDSAGALHVAYMKQFGTDSNSKEIWYATNRSGAWEHTQITFNSVREEFPNLVLDAADNVHIAFHTGTTTSNLIRYVNNVGGAFGSIIDITGSGYVIVKHAIDSTGRAHFVFMSQRSSGTQDVFYTTYTPGVGVGALTNLSNDAAESWYPHLTIGPDDVVHITYQAGNAFGGPLVYLNNSGGAFQPVFTGVLENVETAIPVVAPNGTVSILYETSNTLRLVDDAGVGVFGPALTLFSGGNPAFYERPAFDPAGRRYIAFVSNVLPNRGVYVVAETSSGFSAPMEVSGVEQSRVGAAVAVGPNGRVHITYQLSGFNQQTQRVFADIFLATAPTAGDLNCDGFVNFADISPFIAALKDMAAYQVAYPECFHSNGDTNFDGLVNFADISPFIALLKQAAQ
ncbi:MAG: hypothetical protein IPM18_07570 [Phycisphaerales bacterium]|nr:hypothetical protein [Phycisphaerales bacterium]